jgi:DNA repair exonuclease SbcCD ATPase subunit
MRIERLAIAGFGALRGDVEFSPDRCNLILAANESGKSTLVAALLAGLYGLPEERRSKNRPITTGMAFEPWDGGPYGVTIQFTIAGRGYHLERDLASSRVTLQDIATGVEITDEYRTSGGRHEILERLLQLERGDFLRSALVRQHDIQSVRDSTDITHSLQRFATSQRGDITAGDALEALDRALSRYDGTQLAGPGKVETELARLDAALGEIEARLEELEAERAAADETIGAVEELTARLEELRAERHRLDCLRVQSAIEEIEADLEGLERVEDRLEALESEREDLAPYAGFPLDLMAEMNELRGKSQELTARIEDERAALERDAAQPLQEVRGQREALAAIDALEPGDAGDLPALALKLRDLDEQVPQKSKQVEVERKRLEEEGLDLDEARRIAERFRPLADDDRRFLEGYREDVLELRARRRELEDLPLPDAAHGPPTGKLRRTLSAAAAALLLTAGPLILVTAGWSRSGLTLLLGLLGLVALGGGLLLLRRRSAGSGPSHPEMSALDAELRALDARAEGLRAALGYDDQDALLVAFRAHLELTRRCATLERLGEEAQCLAEAQRVARRRTAEILTRAGVPCAEETVATGAVDDLVRSVDRARRLAEREGELVRRLQVGQSEIEALEQKRLGVGLRMDEILHLAGLRSGEQPPDAINAIHDDIFQEFVEAGRKAERHRHLVAELIPEAQAGGASPERLASRHREKETLEEHLKEILGATPPEPLPQPRHPTSHYTLEHRRIGEKLEATETERRQAHQRVADVLERYRQEVPRLIERREELRSAHRRADSFACSVRLASEVLAEIARQSYEEWAAALNDRTSNVLAHLNPSYRDVRFDTDLSFTLESVASGRRLNRDQVDTQLSSGARDQIYLAVRLAVSDFFSAGPFQVPLILDDVLATSDDRRFDRALRFLAEDVSRRHQVLLLSCQEERHRRWRERHPDLFDARFTAVELPAPRAEP